jgi:hypothetical protein
MVASVRPPNGTESTILVVALCYNVPVWSNQGECIYRDVTDFI